MKSKLRLFAEGVLACALLVTHIQPAVGQSSVTSTRASGGKPWSGIDAQGTSTGETICIGVCDSKEFTIPVHKYVQSDLWNNDTGGKLCTEALNEALYRQDVGEFYKAEAHFDNCAFEESLDYLQSFKRSAEAILIAARRTFKERRDRDALRSDVLLALKELGRGLHIIQDFYAHTNYVELIGDPDNLASYKGIQAKAGRSIEVTEKFAIDLWRDSGRHTVQSLASEQGLVSGTVFYETPRLNKCAAGALTHAELAKDSPNEGNGAKPTRWSNMSRHETAVTLAKYSTSAFLLDMAQHWPEIEGVCGKYIRIIQSMDARSFSAKQ